MTDIQHLISNPKLLNAETLKELRAMVGEYPYFQTARLLYLHNLFVMHDESFGEELKQAALCVTDRNLIFQFVEGANYKIKPRTMGSNGQPSLDRTLSLIDDFLSQIPHEKSEAAHHDSHALSAADATDYTSYLLSLDDISDEEQQEAAAEVQPMRGQEMIDKFISSQAGGRIELPETDEVPFDMPVADYPLEPAAEGGETGGEADGDDGEERVESDVDESCFTETLARIYIKQHRYEKALDIIQRLSLKNPKKNVYFADQIRFLKKLIINSKKQ